MARKRAVGEGTVYYNEQKERWEGQFSYIDPATTKSKRKKITGSTQKEVATAGKNFLKSLEDGLLPEADRITVWEWLERWLADYVKPKVRIKSYEKYECYLRNYIKPPLGETAMKKLKAPDLQRVFNNMLTTGGRKKTGVSTSTVRATRRYVGMAFNKAVQIGLLSKNIVKDTDPPRLVKKDICPLTEAQADNLLKTARAGEYIYTGVKQRQKPSDDTKYLQQEYYMVVLLALNTGMRLGEVFGLKWTDIDFDNNAVHVNRSLVSTGTQGMKFEDPKTKGSKRKIAIPEKIKKSLERYQKQQEWLANALGDKFENKEKLLFTNAVGKPVDTTHFMTRYYKRMVACAGLEQSVTFHDLRHTHATLLLKQGVNIKVISERLGHSTITMTLDTYSHLMPDMQQTAIEALDKMKMG